MNVDILRARLRDHTSTRVQDRGCARAAVAIVLREGDAGAEFLAIRRSNRPGDPWSGHMAFPGGREQAGDADLFTTATRETAEEVGIDLQRDGELIGLLDDLQAFGHGRPLDLIIRPFVCALTAPVAVQPDGREVDAAVWVPVRSLLLEDARRTVEREVGGYPSKHEAYDYQGHVIWGLTYRILTQLLDLLR